MTAYELPNRKRVQPPLPKWTQFTVHMNFKKAGQIKWFKLLKGVMGPGRSEKKPY